jgi:catechol 2,3-dioxygenase-like lactoylglutathione lyase family enzyme
MKLEFHHVAVLCHDIEESLSFYRDLLSLQVVTRLYQEGQFDVAVLSDRSPQPSFLLALHGRPFGGWRRDDYESGGAQLHALGFIANDADTWSDRLCRTPLKLERLPHPFPSSEVLAVRDPAGVHVDLLCFGNPELIPRATSLSRGASGASDIGVEYSFASVSLNCRNTSEVANLKQFYTEELSLELVRDNPDLAMLCDGRPNGSAGIDLFVSEPRVWEKDRVTLTERGPGLHYLCLLVPNLEAAHQDLTRKGVECTMAPTVTEHYDLATYRDPSGVDLAVSSTPWPEWGDGFRDLRDPPYDLAANH